MNKNIDNKNIDNLIEKYMKIYGKKVIEDRAFPSIIDGLKPVQRRILYSMYKNKQISDTKTIKSARVVGNCMGVYHPHGDQSIYETIINMVIPWKNNFPLIKGEGNFSNVDGDPAAAMRYTEITIKNKISKYLFSDLELTDFKPNYDNKTTEPLYLYPKVPFILFNGTLGIGFAIKTSILQYNPEEIINLLLFLIEKKFWNFDNNTFKNKYKNKLLEIFNGPDSSTSCDIKISDKEIENFLFSYQGGKAEYKCKIRLNEKEKQIIIESLIPETNSKNIYNELLDLYINYLDIKSSKKDLNKTLNQTGQYLSLKEKPYNLSKNDKVNIILQYNKTSNLENELIKLLNKSKTIKKTFNFNNIFIDIKNENNISPVYLTLYHYLIIFLNIRKKVIIKRLKKEIENLEIEIEQKDLLLFTVENLKSIQELISNFVKDKSDDINILYSNFKNKFKNISDENIKTILSFNLLRLANIKNKKLKEEISLLKEKKLSKENILKDPNEIFKIIKNELKDFKKDFKNEIKRKSKIIKKENISGSKVSSSIPYKVIISYKSIDNQQKILYIKKVPIELAQKIKENNFLYNKQLTENEYLCFVSNKGKLYNLKISNIDMVDKNLKIYFQLDKDEEIIKFFDKKLIKEKMIFVKENGYIKTIETKELLKYFDNNINIKGKKLFKDTEQKIIRIFNINNELYKNSYIKLLTKLGYESKFNTISIPVQGLSANGVIGIKLNSNDTVIKTQLFNIPKIYNIFENLKEFKTLKEYYNLNNRGTKGKLNNKG